MKVLFLALEPPYPPNDGGRIRTYNILKHIGKRHAVYLLTTAEVSAYPGAMETLGSYCRDIQVLQPPLIPKRSLPQKINDLKRRYPISLDKYASEEIGNTLQLLETRFDFDVVHIDQIYHAQYINNLNSIPIVLTHHNIETLLQRRELWRRPDRFRPLWWLQWLEHFRWQRYESEISRRCDALVVVSELEANYFKSRAPGVPILIVPNGVDTEYFKPNHEIMNPAALLFTGRMNYPPNIDAMIWFCDLILPMIQRQHPSTTLTIVGRDPTSEILALSELPAVSVTGTIPDVRPYYAPASVYVVPLRQGGGTRLKILEAMSMEMPIVTTSIGSEGLELKFGKDIIIADTPEVFASQVGRLIEDTSIRVGMGKRARRTVMQRYEWAAISQEQEKAYQTAIDRHSGKKSQ